VAVETRNQISILPADVAADDIAAIVNCPNGVARTMHVTVDDYFSIADLTRAITRDHGYRFTYHDIPSFIGEMNRRCTRDDPLYPLLDFFNRSASKIAAMQLKRYSNDAYREARARSGATRVHPTLAETVANLVAYMRREGLIPSRARGSR
jgi:hypothetical protein